MAMLKMMTICLKSLKNLEGTHMDNKSLYNNPMDMVMGTRSQNQLKNLMGMDTKSLSQLKNLMDTGMGIRSQNLLKNLMGMETRSQNLLKNLMGMGTANQKKRSTATVITTAIVTLTRHYFSKLK